MTKFDYFLGAFVSMTLHPGYNREDTVRNTFPEIVELARICVKISDEEEKKCQS